MAESNIGEAMDWEGEVSDEGGFTLIPEGTYAFEITKLEKERFEGSAKMAACPRAAITLNICTNSGWTPIVDRIMLNTKMQWRVAKFFEALGFQKNPETGNVPMAWSQVVGKQGWVKVKIRKYTRKDGGEGSSNEVDAYLKPEEWPQAGAAEPVATPAAQAAPAAAQVQTAMPVPQQPQQQPQSGWNM
ncbi:MAG: hypothetical protein RSB04_10820 [Gordonibacter sp.]|uniref:hypothetical protein n=1 Tax=Gordonibacter sp. TaxID=1968902 RepID=UPI002FC9B790